MKLDLVDLYQVSVQEELWSVASWLGGHRWPRFGYIVLELLLYNTQEVFVIFHMIFYLHQVPNVYFS